MDRKRIPIGAQEYDKVAHFEASVVHWSVEHTRLAVKTMDALTTVRDLMAAKNQIVEGLCKTAEIDTSKVVQCRLVRDGETSFMEVILQEDPVPSAPESPPPAEASAPAS